MPLKPTQPNLNVNLKASNESSGKHRSFKDIEELIKSGNTVKKTAPRPPEKLAIDKPTVTSPKTPVKPTKADWLTSLSTAKPLHLPRKRFHLIQKTGTAYYFT